MADDKPKDYFLFVPGPMNLILWRSWFKEQKSQYSEKPNSKIKVRIHGLPRKWWLCGQWACWAPFWCEWWEAVAIYSDVWSPPVAVGGTAAGLSGTFGGVFFWEASICEWRAVSNHIVLVVVRSWERLQFQPMPVTRNKSSLSYSASQFYHQLTTHNSSLCGAHSFLYLHHQVKKQ